MCTTHWIIRLLGVVLLSTVACSDESKSLDAGTDAAVGDLGGAGGAPPTDKAGLFAWLKAGSYKTFERESAAHASAGPHGQVRAYLGATLAASLKNKQTSHPKGSVAVKELLQADGVTLSGWAASIKLEDTSAGGSNWYWYENFSTTSGDSPVAAEAGKAFCVNCHKGGGSDFVLSTYPLK